jgi:glucose-6-phosphatase
VDRAGLGPWLQWASLVADPGLLFVFYFPLVLGVRLASGVRFLGAVILAEWANQILKWQE